MGNIAFNGSRGFFERRLIFHSKKKKEWGDKKVEKKNSASVK